MLVRTYFDGGVVLLYPSINHYSQVVGEVVLLLDVDVEAVGNLVEVVLADAADEAVVAEVVLNALHHVTEGAERVDDET